MSQKTKLFLIAAFLVMSVPVAALAAPLGTWSSELNPAGQTFWGDGAIYGSGYLVAPPQNWSGSGVCLECHGGLNEPFPPFAPIPNKSSYLKTGHGNMLEKVTAGQPFNGPLGVPYPADSVGHVLNWTNATIDLGGTCAGFTGEGQFDAAGCVAGGGIWTPGTRIVNLVGLIGPWMTIDAPDALITGGDLGNVLWMDSGRKYGTCASCHTAGYKASDYTRPNPWATWPATAAGSASGVGGSWVLNGIQCERCHDASGHHTAPSYTATVYSGAASTNLCSQCHIRNAGWEGTANPNASTAPAAWPIPASSTDFSGHVIGKEFLNSPHARFTGTRGQVTDTALYNSYFIVEGGAPGSGCTTCHDVHESVFLEGAEAMKEECTGCHTGAYAKPVEEMNHLGGSGTPLADAGTKPSRPCEICHMPKGMDGTKKAFHIWRINVDPNYSTLTKDGVTPGYCSDPTYITKTTCLAAGKSWSTVAASSPEGSFTNAVWVDVDLACGQCHGGGLNSTSNPPRAGMPYYTKAQLALVAKGMHDSAPVSYAVSFSSTVSPGTYTVNVTATVDCGGACPSLEYDWNWGDATPNGTANPDSHTYASSGTKTIILTVRLAGGGVVGSATRSLTLTPLDLAPVANATCVWDANTWTMQVTDASTDDGGDADALPGDGEATTQVIVDWGDGSTKSVGTVGSVKTRTYALPGTYPVTDKAIDAKLQSSTYTCTTSATPAYFTISGTVKNSGNTANVTYASVQLYKGTSLFQTKSTGATGTFSFTNLKPATYSIKVVKTGYTFAIPAWGPTAVGPSATGLTINSITP